MTEYLLVVTEYCTETILEWPHFGDEWCIEADSESEAEEKAIEIAYEYYAKDFKDFSPYAHVYSIRD